MMLAEGGGGEEMGWGAEPVPGIAGRFAKSGRSLCSPVPVRARDANVQFLYTR